MKAIETRRMEDYEKIPCKVINSHRIRNGLVCLTDLKDEDPVHMYSIVFQDGNLLLTL